MSEFHFRLYFSPFWIKTQLSFFFLKMATGGHFGCPKFIFVGISRHFGSKHSFHFFSENGRRWPFWMSEIYFRLHFSPFRIKTQFSFFFMKMAAGGHFGCPKFIFVCISRQFLAHRANWRDVSSVRQSSVVSPSVRPSPPVSWKLLDKFFYNFTGRFLG